MGDNQEAAPLIELASDQELQELYELGEGWLLRYGANSHSLGAKIHGSVDGLDITDEQPLFSYLITEQEARNISNEAADTLQLGGNLEMSFGVESYIRNNENPAEPYYELPLLMFHISRPEGDMIAGYTLSIEMDGEQPVSYRSEEQSAKLPKPPKRTFDDALEETFGRLRLENQIGYNKLTKEEVSALRTLLEGVIANPPTPPVMS